MKITGIRLHFGNVYKRIFQRKHLHLKPEITDIHDDEIHPVINEYIAAEAFWRSIEEEISESNYFQALIMLYKLLNYVEPRLKEPLAATLLKSSKRNALLNIGICYRRTQKHKLSDKYFTLYLEMCASSYSKKEIESTYNKQKALYAERLHEWSEDEIQDLKSTLRAYIAETEISIEVIPPIFVAEKYFLLAVYHAIYGNAEVAKRLLRIALENGCNQLEEIFTSAEMAPILDCEQFETLILNSIALNEKLEQRSAPQPPNS